MSRLNSGWRITALSALVLLALRATTAGQTMTAPDTLSALLIEVRGLRAAMEQMASAGPGCSWRLAACNSRNSA
jgi:hypothetical protein